MDSLWTWLYLCMMSPWITDDTEARVGIQHCLNTESCDGDAPTDADAILDWGHNFVVGFLEPVIEECPCEEMPIRSANVDRLAVR